MTDNGDKPRRPFTARVFKLLVIVLVFAVIAGAAGIMLYWDQFGPAWAGTKLDAATVIIESDDWGLDYEPPRFVLPTPRLDERQAAGVKRLVKVLDGHQDSLGRKPVISAFIVVHQADSTAIAKDPELKYHSRPIDKTMPKTVSALKRAEAKGVFSLVYHGRDHRDAGLWVKKVRQSKPFDPEVVTTFHPREDSRGQDQCIAEYFDSRDGYLQPLAQDVIDEKVRTGLAEFERIFGRRPVSTVAPRYLWGPRAEAAWHRHGIKYVHGANKQGGAFRNTTAVWTRRFGSLLSHGLVGIPRTADIEAGKDGRPPPLSDVMRWAHRAVATGQPIVICTHNCNYVGGGPYPQNMAQCLDTVLTTLEKKYPDLRYLTAEEAGQLAAEGAVHVATPGGTAEIRAAGGLKHAWLWLKGIYHDRAKARLYARGLGVLAGLTVLAALVRIVGLLVGRRRRPA